MATVKQPKLPVILYEESVTGQQSSPIPYIETTKDEIMPPVLFIFEYKDTGETEPGPKGEPLAIVDQFPHQYVDMQFVKEKTTPELFDQLRVALGMKTLKEAQKSGQEILDKVYNNLQMAGLPIEEVVKKK